ncbi:VIT1/CCC1 transporter family protein [Devriesea agamarum]|uniref:VIT1/CCC1 transporter family protein n=1 Tax=Devriesea agamarum TaxID=472569 RepID=UPI0038B3F4F9
MSEPSRPSARQIPPPSHAADEPCHHSPAQIARWRRYLADEIAEAEIYRTFAAHRTGEEREILLAIADAEKRHEAHWRTLLGPHADSLPRIRVRRKLYALLSRLFGSLFVLVLLQRAEARSPYESENDATEQMAADERIHSEVIRGLAARGRSRLSGTFRAAVFGANDGLVSNLALVMGMAATGVSSSIVLASGISGLLAGALSMAAGEYVSVSSQRELLEASSADPEASDAIPYLDLDRNELALVYRARGMSESEADAHASKVIAGQQAMHEAAELNTNDLEEIGSGRGAALSSFLFFALGAIIPVLPYLLGLTGTAALIVALVLVGISLLVTGGVVGVLSGASPLRRGLRQLAIGYGAAIATYILGLLFGTTLS